MARRENPNIKFVARLIYSERLGYIQASQSRISSPLAYIWIAICREIAPRHPRAAPESRRPFAGTDGNHAPNGVGEGESAAQLRRSGEVASLAGFEPATRCLEGSRSIH